MSTFNKIWIESVGRWFLQWRRICLEYRSPGFAGICLCTPKITTCITCKIPSCFCHLTEEGGEHCRHWTGLSFSCMRLVKYSYSCICGDCGKGKEAAPGTIHCLILLFVGFLCPGQELEILSVLAVMSQWQPLAIIVNSNMNTALACVFSRALSFSPDASAKEFTELLSQQSAASRQNMQDTAGLQKSQQGIQIPWKPGK